MSKASIKNIKVAGPLNEKTNFDVDFNEGFKELIFDFEKTSFVTSQGVNLWLNFVTSVPKDIKISYTNCPVMIIKSINLVPGVYPEGATIDSFYIPYICESCDLNMSLKLTKGKHYKRGEKLSKFSEKMTCPSCGDEMVIEVVPETYFQFLERC